MKSTWFYTLILSALFAGFALAAEQPNIILILTDDNNYRPEQTLDLSQFYT